MPRRNAMLSAMGIPRVERAVKCHHCEKDFPSVCKTQVDDIWKKLPFTCDSCMKELGLHKASKFTALNLPKTALSNKVEININAFLEDNNAEEKITIRSFSRKGLVEFESESDSELESEQSCL